MRYNDWRKFFYEVGSDGKAHQPTDLSKLFNKDDEDVGETFIDAIQNEKNKPILSDIIKKCAALRKVVYKHSPEWIEDPDCVTAFAKGYSDKNRERVTAQQKALAFDAAGVPTDNWYFHPISFIDHLNKIATPRGILKITSHDLMTDVSIELNVKLGQSSTILFRDQGCYVTTYANIAKSAFMEYGKLVVTDEAYLEQLGINDDKNLFDTGEAFLSGSAALNAIFGAGNWKEYSKEETDTEGIKMLAKLHEWATDGIGYMIVGIFDLRDANPKIVEHAVGITGLPNADGVFDGTIASSSSNDVDVRLANETQKTAYAVKNLIRIRAIEVFK